MTYGGPRGESQPSLAEGLGRAQGPGARSAASSRCGPPDRRPRRSGAPPAAVRPRGRCPPARRSGGSPPTTRSCRTTTSRCSAHPRPRHARLTAARWLRGSPRAGVVPRGDAVLRDHEREPDPGGRVERGVESVGVHLPAHQRERRARRRRPEASGDRRIGAHARVVLDAEEVAGLLALQAVEVEVNDLAPERLGHGDADRIIGTRGLDGRHLEADAACGEPAPHGARCRPARASSSARGQPGATGSGSGARAGGSPGDSRTC